MYSNIYMCVDQNAFISREQTKISTGLLLLMVAIVLTKESLPRVNECVWNSFSAETRLCCVFN